MKRATYLAIAIILFAIIQVNCKKIDVTKNEATSLEYLFFSKRPTNNQYILKVLDFVKRENNKHGFVKKVISSIGYPYWDKAMIIEIPSKFSRTNSDPDTVVFIPFVRENQLVVNASLVFGFSGTDTTIKYVCDWQYKERVNGSIESDTTAENLASLLMI